MASGYEHFLSYDWSDERWRTYLHLAERLLGPLGLVFRLLGFCGLWLKVLVAQRLWVFRFFASGVSWVQALRLRRVLHRFAKLSGIPPKP